MFRGTDYTSAVWCRKVGGVILVAVSHTQVFPRVLVTESDGYEASYSTIR